MSRTLGQQRAEYCLKELKKLKCGRDDFKKLSAGLPAMIMQNGFGQTLAFLAAKSSKTEQGHIVFKKEDKHYAALSIITGWLKAPEVKVLPAALATEKELLLSISTMEQPDFLRAQKETLAMLEWLKRYANAALFED